MEGNNEEWKKKNAGDGMEEEARAYYIVIEDSMHDENNW